MLKGIDPVIGPELLGFLRAMGHGDEIVVADANFPAATHARRLARADGIDAMRMVRAIAGIMPLDDFVAAAAFSMAPTDAPDTTPPIVADFAAVLVEAGYDGPIEALGRFAFYERAGNAFA